MMGKKPGPSCYLTVCHAKGETRQACVAKDQKKIAEAWIRNYHRFWETLGEISRINLELLRRKEPIPKS